MKEKKIVVEVRVVGEKDDFTPYGCASLPKRNRETVEYHPKKLEKELRELMAYASNVSTQITHPTQDYHICLHNLRWKLNELSRTYGRE